MTYYSGPMRPIPPNEYGDAMQAIDKLMPDLTKAKGKADMLAGKMPDDVLDDWAHLVALLSDAVSTLRGIESKIGEAGMERIRVTSDGVEHVSR